MSLSIMGYVVKIKNKGRGFVATLTDPTDDQGTTHTLEGRPTHEECLQGIREWAFRNPTRAARADAKLDEARKKVLVAIQEHLDKNRHAQQSVFSDTATCPACNMPKGVQWKYFASTNMSQCHCRNPACSMGWLPKEMPA